MAVFGFQLLLTIIILSVLNKIPFKYSFSKWVLMKGGLIRYLPPTNEQLKDAIAHSRSNESQTAKNPLSNSNPTTSDRHRKNNRKNQNYVRDKSDTFCVPRNIMLALHPEPLHFLNLTSLPYYDELRWLIDFSFCTVLVYFITEAYYTFSSKNIANEYNLSIVWCLLSLKFVLKTLWSITATYFRGEESIGERSICIVSFCTYLLVAMVILITDEETLEFGLVDAYRNFSRNAYRLLEFQGVIQNAYGPSSFLMIKFWLAIIGGLIGALFAFPGLRMAQMHFDALVYAKNNQLLTSIYHIAFISPLLIILTWVKPVVRYNLVERNSMTNDTFESIRLLLILLILTLRFCLFRKYLQSYLNIAPQKISFLKKQSGKITNKDVQKLVARVNYYFSVASLQYLAPLLLCLFLTLLTKSTGDYKWTGSLFVNNASNSNIITSQPFNNGSDIILNPENADKNVEADFAKLTLSRLRDVFNPIVLRAFNGFLLWWTCTVWFSTSVVGFVYNSYFRQ